ncbi:DUF2637 domain-containing protein [Nocardia vinacea]|uniref:DUF2637 domain-containing protein n=1 Tax=Nocardia vinacea TaxID=96468 RepID=UPI0002FBB0A8|nr:DUF2637 domain-containing protein [Nocardia vinacea]
MHASAIVTGVVALTSFEMSFAALHDLAVRNLVAPALAANVPIAIDGLVVGSIIATATFRRGSSGWWYATALFVFWTLVSVAGNIEYAREIGGSPVSLALYAGMPMTMLFAVHLTLMLFGRRREHARTENHVPAPQEDQAPASQDDHAPAPQHDHAPAPQQDHAPAAQQDHAPAAQQDHAPAAQKDHAPAAQKDHAPAAQKDWVSAEQDDWVSAEQDDWDLAALEEDWDSAAEEDRNSAPPPERVVPTRIPAILENTDPLLVAPKAMLPNALPRTGATPRITPTFVATGPNGQTKINPF